MSKHSYTEIEFKNAPDHKTTPLNAANLNHIEEGITNAFADISDTQEVIAPVEDTLTASQAYAVGDQFIYQNVLYKATAAISAGGSITLNGNCVLSKSVTEQLKGPNSEIVTVNSTVGTIGNRTICKYGKLRSLCVELTLTQAVTANSALFSIVSPELYPIAVSCGEVIDLNNGIVTPVHLNTSGVCIKSAIPLGDASIASGHTIVITISYKS